MNVQKALINDLNDVIVKQESGKYSNLSSILRCPYFSPILKVSPSFLHPFLSFYVHNAVCIWFYVDLIVIQNELDRVKNANAWFEKWKKEQELVDTTTFLQVR